MLDVFPIELEEFLAPGLSHLVARVDDPDIPERLRGHLNQLGISIEQQHTFTDKNQSVWLVVSVPVQSARPLVLELIESGFPETLYGIDANPV